MDPLSMTASIITVVDLTVTVMSFLNGIKDASKERARCAMEASDVFNLLTNLRCHLEEAKPEDPWFTAVRTLGTENGPLDQFKATLEQLISKSTPVDGFKNIGKVIVWKLDKAEVNDTILKIERFKSLIQIALEMDHFKLSQAIKGDVTELVEGFKRIEHREANSYHRTIADWLTPIDFAKQQTDFIARRQKDTGLWFLESAQFTTWLNSVKQTLFCPGIPGAGKTTMASIVIDHLWTTFNDGNTGIAFLYCNYKRQEEQKAVDLLAALLKQLVQDKPSIPQPLKALFECHVHRRTWPSFEEIAQVLRSVVSGYTRVYVVVDALDECLDLLGTRTAILSELRTLQAIADVRLMATSRFNSNIQQEFKRNTSLEIRASNADVKRYTESHISRLSRCVQDNPDLQRAVTEAITEAVDGMFLLAQLHLDSLTDKKTVKAIKSALATLPKGSDALDGAYKEAVDRLDSQSRGDRDLAHNVISWLVNAQRPLTTTELQHALAIEPGEHELDEDNLPVIEEMVSVCLGLVTVDDESNIIRLVHYTTQDYFENLQVDWNASGPASIALMCITYLSFDVFANGYCQIYEKIESRLAQYKFLAYAASHWADHAHRAQEEVKAVALNLLQSETLVTNLSYVLYIGRSSHLEGLHRSLETKGMHLAAESDLQVLTKCLLEDGASPDPSDARGETPLFYASQRGHEKIVEQLLDHNANANWTNRYGQAALHVAVSARHEKIVELLLNQNIDVNLQDKGGRTALHMTAAWDEHHAIVKLLLDHNPDTSLVDGNGQTALQVARQNGLKGTVRLIDLHTLQPSYPTSLPPRPHESKLDDLRTTSN